ncbi:MAG: ABC transporter ATP-binding protein [Ruminococcaceae bacterium]|nr:ABC transporter ATP-binding protein [Oscillospiraceae bacterium]
MALKRLFGYLRPFGKRMSVGLVIKIMGTLVELALPYILSIILDEAVPAAAAAGDTGAGIRGIIFWSCMMLVCTVAALVLNITANRMASGVAKDAARNIRHDLFDSTMRLSCNQVDEFTVPSLESRLTSDTYNVHHVIGMIQRLGVRAPILLIGGIAITLSLDATLALVMLAVLPFISLTVYIVSRRGVKLYRNSQRAGDEMVRIVREDVQGIRVIKALSRKYYERKRYAASVDKLVGAETKASLTMSISNPLMNVFLNLGLVAVLFVGALRVDGGECAPGKIIAFIQYFTLISNAMLFVTRIFMMCTKGSASMNRICEVIDAANAQPAQVEDQPSDITGGDGDYLTFDGVDFSYFGYKGGALNLSDVSFSLRRGGTLGIIGATGSGKTTVLSLLMRFYELPTNCGRILLDGKDIREIPPRQLRRRVGIAMQNDFLYAGTIEENIDFGRGLSHEEIVRAAEIAQAADFIGALADGYEHKITAKGTNLSGGQKQRLLIARAVAGNPEILILDDASSALDYRTDAALRARLRELAGEGGTPITSIVVAQRISSVQYADLILVLDGGKIIGSGTHEELLESCDVYREISESQMGGAILD